MIYASWNERCNRQFLVILGHFLHFHPLKTPKIIFWKIEKSIWRYYHFTHVHHKWLSFFVILDCFFALLHPSPLWTQKIKILKEWTPWQPQKSNFEKLKKAPGDIMILKMRIYHKWQPHDVWFLSYEAWQTKFLVFWIISCHFTPLLTQKIKILKKWKNTGEITTRSLTPQQFRKSKYWKNEKTTQTYCHLHMCIINDNHMMYGSWDMEHGQQNCLSFWTIFCLFTPPPHPP